MLVSIDTMHAVVARAALDAGARLVNDVSGGLADPLMAATVAAAGVPYVAMHWRAPSSQMNDYAVYRDVVTDVTAELRRRAGELIDCGVGQDQIMLDPGLGFAKRPAHDWALLGHLGELRDLGFPLLVRRVQEVVLGAVLAEGREPVSPPAARDTASAAVSALAAAAGAYCVRVHDVPASLDAVRVAAAWRKGAADAIPGGAPGP